MKALVYKGPGNIQLEERPKPKIQKPTDCIVKIDKTTICGTDLHIIKGDVPTVEKGRILGHEGIGTIEEVGAAVSNFQIHDKVLISCITSCNRCAYCKEKMYSHCADGGWILGNKIDGTQAEYVRIAFADTSLYPIPPNLEDEELVLLSDIFPTGYETGVLKGQIAVGSTVAIVGAGPIGLATLLTAQLYCPSQIFLLDLDEHRLQIAKKLGASATINIRESEALSSILKLTNQQGVDVAIEAVGTPEAFDICQSILRPGGHLANIGVHGKSVLLRLETLWHHNITLTATLVDTFSIATLLKMVQSGKLRPKELITHHFPLARIMEAYQVFRDASKQKALKVIIENKASS